MQLNESGIFSTRYLGQALLIIISLLDDAFVVVLSRLHLHIPGLRWFAFGLLAYMITRWIQHFVHYLTRLRCPNSGVKY